jgi:hypothetical protein
VLARIVPPAHELGAERLAGILGLRADTAGDLVDETLERLREGVVCLLRLAAE